MKDPKNIKELNELFKLLESAFMESATRVRTLTALRARYIRKGKKDLATITETKIKEYRRFGRRCRSRRGESRMIKGNVI